MFRIIQEGTGQVRNLVICYYLGAYADHLITKIVPKNYCVINDTRQPTRVYTKIDITMKKGIMPLSQVVKWVENNLNCSIDEVITGAYSAGAQAIRTLLINAEHSRDIPAAVFVADGTHCSLYPKDWQLKYWIDYCKLAKANKTIALFSHTQITPTTFTGTRETLRLITGFKLTESGPLHTPVVTKDGCCEVWSYEGNSASAHCKQAQIIFAKLLKHCLKIRNYDLGEILNYSTSFLSRRALLSGVIGTGIERLSSTYMIGLGVFSRYLRQGIAGEDVKEWQKVLIKSGHYMLPYENDGIFGPLTDHATRMWQLRHGLSPDGIVGEYTRDLINAPYVVSSRPVWLDPNRPLGERALVFSLNEKLNNIKEIPNNSNRAPRIREYFKRATRLVNGKETTLNITSGPWCAAAACYATYKVLLNDEKMPHKYRISGLELIADSIRNNTWYLAHLVQKKHYKIKIGDIAIFNRSTDKKHTAWWRHVARVAIVPNKHGTFVTLGGNEEGTYRLTKRNINDIKFLGCIGYP